VKLSLRSYFDLYSELSNTDMESYEQDRWRRYLPFLSFMNMNRGDRVLEVGCGQGELLELIQQEKKAIVVGFDLSPNYLKMVKARGIDVVLGVAEALPFASDAFNVTVLDCIIEHVLDVGTVMGEVARVTEKSVYIEVPYREKIAPYVHGRGMPHIRSFAKEDVSQIFGRVKKTRLIYARNIGYPFRLLWGFVLRTGRRGLILVFDSLFLKFGIGNPVFILVEKVKEQT